MMSIVIGADIVPTNVNESFFSQGEMTFVVDSGLDFLLKQAGFRIFNLETPLTDLEKPIQKSGPVLKAGVSTVNGLKALGVDLLTLANNHIMDHGEIGLKSTIEILNKERILSLGAGRNLKESARPFSFLMNKKRVGVYACAENEFSIAGTNTPGANPFDPLESFDCVASLKKENDYVIVLYHGGKEYYRYPSPMLQRVCRKFVEYGADIVICQHSHCIGCEEKFLHGTIVYGQGNFIFAKKTNIESQTSLLVEIDENFKIKYIPLEMFGCGVRLATGTVAESILNDFFQRSEQIKQPGFVEEEYENLAKKMLTKYLLNISGYNRSVLNRIIKKIVGKRFLSFFVKRKFSDADKLYLRAILQCETHRELLLRGLKISTGERNVAN